jgi:hypothetical protein
VPGTMTKLTCLPAAMPSHAVLMIIRVNCKKQ